MNAPTILARRRGRRGAVPAPRSSPERPENASQSPLAERVDPGLLACLVAWFACLLAFAPSRDNPPPGWTASLVRAPIAPDHHHHHRALQAPASTVPRPGPFTDGFVPTFHIRLAPDARRSLQTHPRRFVTAQLSDELHDWPRIALRLKGATGSFRPIGDLPSFTADFARLDPEIRFHGITRLHLNNSVEDPSRLHEKVASLVFAQAGLPMPRVAHARVDLDGRDLGLYVLKEGLTEGFLHDRFPGVTGVLLEPAPGSDVDGTLNLQAGHPAVTPAVRLAEACRVTDPAQRRERLARFLDLPRFLDFMALEVLLGHRDGYTMARNNYRLHWDAGTERATFLPHGLDQLLGNPDLPWLPHAAGLVARAVLEIPEYRAAYRSRLVALHREWLLEGRLEQLYAAQAGPLEPALTRAERTRLRSEWSGIRDRIRARSLSLQRQWATPESPLLDPVSDPMPLTDWTPSSTGEGGVGGLAVESAPDGRPALRLDSQPGRPVHWTKSLRLTAGRYRFEGLALVRGLVPLPYGRHHGAGLRIAGATRESAATTPEGEWHPLRTEFVVPPEAPTVQLLCEWRAREGQVWFDLASLHLRRLNEPSPGRPPQPME